MAFLSVNGLVLPCTIDSAGIDTTETDSDGKTRSVDGSAMRTRLSMRRTVVAKTPPVDIERAYTIKQMVRGMGFVCPFADAAFTGSRAKAPDSSQLQFQAVRAADGRGINGGGGAASTNYATYAPAIDNILYDTDGSVASAGDTSGSISSFAGQFGGVIAMNFSYCFEGSRSVQFTAPGANANEMVTFTTASVTAGRQYQFSFWAVGTWPSIGVTLLIGGGEYNVSNRVCTLAGGDTTLWTRVVVNFTPATSGSFCVRITGGQTTSTSRTYWLDAFQLLDVTGNAAAQSNPPPFVRAATSGGGSGLTYTGLGTMLGSAQGCTLNLWASPYPLSSTTGTGTLLRVADTFGAGSAQSVALQVANSGSNQLTWLVTVGGQTATLAVPTTNYTPSAVSLLTLMMRAAPVGNQSAMSAYLNGVRVASLAAWPSGGAPTPLLYTGVQIGASSGTFGEVDVLPCVLDSADMANIYAAKVAMAAVPRLAIQGAGFAENMLALGSVTKDTFADVYDKGLATVTGRGRYLELSFAEI